MLGSKHNWNWQVGLVPVSNPNVVENKTSNISELLCSIIVDPPQHTTIFAEADSGAYNSYCHTEVQLVLTDTKYTRNGTTVKLTNNTTMNATKTGNTPFSRNISLHTKKSQIFYGMQSNYIISLDQLYDNDCITIFDKSKSNIIKESKLILKAYR